MKMYTVSANQIRNDGVINKVEDKSFQSLSAALVEANTHNSAIVKGSTFVGGSVLVTDEWHDIIRHDVITTTVYTEAQDKAKAEAEAAKAKTTE